MVEAGSTSMRGSVARSQTPRSHNPVNASSNPAPHSNEYRENVIYQKLLDPSLLKEEEDRKKHSSSTTLKLHASVEETLKTADGVDNEFYPEREGLEDQRKGNFPNGASISTLGQDEDAMCDAGVPACRLLRPSNDQQPRPRCGSIRVLMKAAIAEKMRISSIMEARV